MSATTASAGTSGLLAGFDFLDSAVDAIEGLRKAGFKKITAYVPYPEHHIEAALGYGQSPVRVFTLVGGLTGAATGLALTTWTSALWPLVVGGKPIIGIPAYIVITFELAVLFGALSTLIGLGILARLPDVKPSVAYDPEFSAGRYGLWVVVPTDRVDEARRILEAQEPAELRVGEREAADA
jgi:Alternative complex III, ActD subunit